MWFRKERGQAMVEFALVLPLLMILLCGIVDFGWIFGNQLQANNACREAARACAIQSELPQSELQQLAETVISDRADTLCGFCPVFVTVSQEPDTDGISVSLTCQLPLLTPVTSRVIGSTYTIHAKTVMRAE
jgi:Flp pilus assembly protein TadG